jgi:hypothetical protein
LARADRAPDEKDTSSGQTFVPPPEDNCPYTPAELAQNVRGRQQRRSTVRDLAETWAVMKFTIVWLVRAIWQPPA